MVSSEIAIALLISCDVRKPSKKCMKGMRASSVAMWAIRARSPASCTELDASIAYPVDLQAMTSEWSPNMDSACVAMDLAVT